MDPREKTTSSDAAYAWAAQKIKWLRIGQRLSQKDLELDMKRKGHVVSQTSVSNVERGKHSSQVGNFQAFADYFGIPLWLLFLPGDPQQLLEGDRRKRIVQLVEDYLSCDDEGRKHTENMAAAHASVKPRK